MKKLLVALALLIVSTLGYADDDEVKVVPMDRIRDGIRFDQGIAIVDGKSVYFCTYTRGCVPIADDYTKELKIPKK